MLAESKRLMLVLGFLALLVGVAYGNSLRNGFAFDDELLIVRNGLITKLETIPKLLVSDYWITRRDPYGDPASSSGLYRPLVHLTLAANYALGGLNPSGYHVVNLVLHCLVTWLLYLIALQLRFEPEAAAVAAVLFAVHPLHTEAVANVTGRGELLMALGVLGGLWCAMTGRRWWSLGAFGIGLFSKEQALMLPALLLLYDICLAKGTASPPQRTSHIARRTRLLAGLRAAAMRYGSYAAVLVGYLLVRRAALGRFELPPTPMLDNPLTALAGADRFFSTLKVDGLYLWLCVWPVRLSLDYSYDAIPAARSLLEPGVWGGLFGWGGLVGWMIWSFVRGDRRVTFSIGLTVLLFLPASNLVILIGTILGERLFYLTSAGMCLLV